MAHNISLSPEEQKKANIIKIWRVAGILALVTAVEFALAFLWPDGSSRTMLNILFIILTLVKAFYIVSEFMHLGHEVKLLAYTVVLPMVFVIWLLVALIIEGDAILAMGEYLWGS